MSSTVVCRYSHFPFFVCSSTIQQLNSFFPNDCYHRGFSVRIVIYMQIFVVFKQRGMKNLPITNRANFSEPCIFASNKTVKFISILKPDGISERRNYKVHHRI